MTRQEQIKEFKIGDLIIDIFLWTSDIHYKNNPAMIIEVGKRIIKVKYWKEKRISHYTIEAAHDMLLPYGLLEHQSKKSTQEKVKNALMIYHQKFTRK